MTVTLTPKCYMSICTGCGDLFQSSRKDKLTCSDTCRVRAHRNGSLETLRKEAEHIKVPPALLQQLKAINILLPHEVCRVIAGEVEADDLQPEANAAFIRMLMKLIEEAGSHD